MLGLNLETTGVALGLTGVSLLSASSTSLVLRSSCPLLGHSSQSTVNMTNTTTTEQKQCPLSLLTRTGLVLGLVTLGTGSALRVVSLFR